MLPFQRRASVGDQRLQTWNSPHAFLAERRGDGSDHALLLCSLLLGFGLDAFVCVGHVFAEGEGQDDAGALTLLFRAWAVGTPSLAKVETRLQ